MNHKSVFTCHDYNSGDGFLTYVWGPSLWMSLHIISMNYPIKPTAVQKKEYKAFFDSLKYVLPCGKCRDNLIQNFKTTNYGKHVFKNRETLSRWVFDLHNEVNRMLGKSQKVSFDDVRNRYEHFRARCGLKETIGRRTRRRMHGGGKKTQQSKKQKVLEDGCTVPLTGIKSKCVIQIVPKHTRVNTMSVDKRCLCQRV